MFKNILVATDMITEVDVPVLTAIDLARQYGSGLHVIHVLESSSTDDRSRVAHFQTGDQINATDSYMQSVQGQIQKTYPNDLIDSGKSLVNICTGYPWEEIGRAAKAIDADLILLGPHSNRAEKKGVVRQAEKIGSTVQEVISRETCPVMIINKPVPKDKLAFKKIVIGVDFSISCECALCLSVKLSQNFDSILYPFFMIPVPPYPKYTRSEYEANTEMLKGKVEEFCDIYLEGTKHQYKIWSGALPYNEVLNCAEKTDADLIILGSHTKQKEGKWYAGSVVDRVSFKADCPVLAVNDPRALKKINGIKLPETQRNETVDRSIHLFSKSDESDIA